MERREFTKICGLGCLGAMVSSSLLVSCTGVKYLNAPINGKYLELDLKAFQKADIEASEFLDYVVVQNEGLRYPICVYRESASSFKALLMKCTHQGTELQVYGSRLQCPAHGSEFTNKGLVANGPADENLRSFPTELQDKTLRINLA